MKRTMLAALRLSGTGVGAALLGAAFLWVAPASAQTSSQIVRQNASLIPALETRVRDHDAARDFALRLAEAETDSNVAADLRRIAERHERLKEASERLIESLHQEFNEAWVRESMSVALQDYSTQQEAKRGDYDAASGRLDRAGEGGARGQRFAEGRARDADIVIEEGKVFRRVIVDSTGEVVVNDRADMIEAKLEDLGRRQDELLARTGKTTGAAAQKKLRAELAALDREIKAVMDQLARNGAAGRPICSPQNVAFLMTGCDYVAQNMPFTIPQGEGPPVVIERFVLSIAEREYGPWKWSIAATYHQGQTRGSVGGAGDLLTNADGNNVMLAYWTDEDGNRQVRKIPLRIEMRSARAEGLEWLLDIVHGVRPKMNLSFVRDPANFPPAEQARLRAAAARSAGGDARASGGSTSSPAQGASGSGADDDIELVPLLAPSEAQSSKGQSNAQEIKAPSKGRKLLDEAGKEAKGRIEDAARGLLRRKLF